MQLIRLLKRLVVEEAVAHFGSSTASELAMRLGGFIQKAMFVEYALPWLEHLVASGKLSEQVKRIDGS